MFVTIMSGLALYLGATPLQALFADIASLEVLTSSGSASIVLAVLVIKGWPPSGC